MASRVFRCLSVARKELSLELFDSGELLSLNGLVGMCKKMDSDVASLGCLYHRL